MRLKKHSKALVSFALVVAILCCQYIPVSAHESENDAAVVLLITNIDEESSIATATVVPASDYMIGDVVGDGVRLRSGPSTSSAILELMYFGEEVYVDLSRSKVDGFFTTWYYVQRKDTTKTWGYADVNYIYLRTQC